MPITQLHKCVAMLLQLGGYEKGSRDLTCMYLMLSMTQDRSCDFRKALEARDVSVECSI